MKKIKDIGVKRMVEITNKIKSELGDIITKYQNLLNESKSKDEDYVILSYAMAKIMDEMYDNFDESDTSAIFEDSEAAHMPMPDAVVLQCANILFDPNQSDILYDFDSLELDIEDETGESVEEYIEELRGQSETEVNDSDEEIYGYIALSDEVDEDYVMPKLREYNLEVENVRGNYIFKGRAEDLVEFIQDVLGVKAGSVRQFKLAADNNFSRVKRITDTEVKDSEEENEPKKVIVSCETSRTRDGFKHIVKIDVDGKIYEGVVGYINRTWEAYDYQTALIKAVKQMNIFSEDEISDLYKLSSVEDVVEEIKKRV